MKSKAHGFRVGVRNDAEGALIEVDMIGKLTHEDYAYAIPVMESAIKHAKSVKMLADLRYLEGWELHAAWDDFRFGLEHRNDFTKIALVGEQKWVEWSTKLSKHLMGGEIKHFEKLADALVWLKA